MAYNVAILYGSVRQSRLGIRAVRWMEHLVRERGCEPVVVDQQEYQLPLLETPLHHYPEPSQAPDNVQRAAAALTAADGFVVVGGEYNHAIQPGLSNLIDYFYRAQYAYKPALICSYSYGPFGGVRAATQLRTHLAEVGMVTIPTTIAVASIMESLNTEGVPQRESMGTYARAAMDEFEFYLRALATERAKGTPAV